MKVIQVNSFLSTNLYPDFAQINTIEIENKPIAEGAFGAVYQCISINGTQSVIPQVIKIFKEDIKNKQDHNFNTIQKLQNKLSIENSSLPNLITDEYPSLKAIPQFSFEGSINGKIVRGFSSTNLKKIGFVEFIDVLENDQLLSNYQKMGIDKKMILAYHLVAGFMMLQKIFFIHADLKPEALFINTQTNECTIIDFDSGAITDNANDEPNVWGAHNDWVAPEIWDQLKNTNSNGIQKVKVNLLTDLWSVAIGIHYLLTTTHPLFYLKELSPRVTNPYFSKYKWPNIDIRENYFNHNNLSIYQPLKDWLQNILHPSILNELEKTINYGYKNPIKRTTYNQWENVLKVVQNPPVINYFTGNHYSIVKGIPIVLKWDVTNAFKIEMDNGIGTLNLKGEQEIHIHESTVFKLTTHGYFGIVSQEVSVSVFPTPIMKSLIVSSPNFNQHVVLKIETPKFNTSNTNAINIDHSIKINHQQFESINYTQRILFPLNEIKKIKRELDQHSIKYKFRIIYGKIKNKINHRYRK